VPLVEAADEEVLGGGRDDRADGDPHERGECESPPGAVGDAAADLPAEERGDREE
jgi:hypothetical protein